MDTETRNIISYVVLGALLMIAARIYIGEPIPLPMYVFGFIVWPAVLLCLIFFRLFTFSI